MVVYEFLDTSFMPGWWFQILPCVCLLLPPVQSFILPWTQSGLYYLAKGVFVSHSTFSKVQICVPYYSLSFPSGSWTLLFLVTVARAAMAILSQAILVCEEQTQLCISLDWPMQYLCQKLLCVTLQYCNQVWNKNMSSTVLNTKMSPIWLKENVILHINWYI